MPARSPAQTLLDKADKKANSSTGWFSSASTKFEEAGDLYQQAANSFKIEKLYKEAGDTFSREAECREKCKETNDAANAWWNAAKAYKKTHPDLAIQALTQTITHLCQSGRFRQAADREKEIGQIHLQEFHDLGKACDSFVRAGDWYAQEDAAATANACYKDAADLLAELDQFSQAIARYEQVADHSLNSALTKYSVKEYWLRALLCALAMNDIVTVKRNVIKYGNQDSTFPSTREAKFATTIAEAVEANDQDMFTAAVGDYDSVTRLDNWKTAILLKIKRNLEQPGQDSGFGGLV
ncbi:vesicular-fusion protein S17 [Leucoagaricus gongylophorus]